MQQTVHSERMDADGNTGYAMEYITQKIFAKNKIKKTTKKTGKGKERNLLFYVFLFFKMSLNEVIKYLKIS